MQTKPRIEAELGACLGDRDHAVVIRDVVDASRPARKREQRGVRRGIDVQRRPADGLVVLGPHPIEKAIAQDDAIEAGSEHLSLHIGGGFDRDRPRRVGEIERIGLGMRLAAWRITKCDALNDEAHRPGQPLPGSHGTLVFLALLQ